MKLTKDEVLKLAELCRLQLSDDEVAMFEEQLSGILSYVQKLDAVDTADLQPTYQVTGLSSQDPNAMRDDETTPQVSHEELMKNVPSTEGRQIKVKRMIG